MKPKKYASKEGYVAYGYEGYFKVPSVMVITATLDSTSKRKQQKQTAGGHRSFEQVLLDETDRLNEEHSLDGKAITYAKDGKVWVGQTISRTYN